MGPQKELTVAHVPGFVCREDSTHKEQVSKGEPMTGDECFMVVIGGGVFFAALGLVVVFFCFRVLETICRISAKTVS